MELLQHRQSTQRRHTRHDRGYPLVLVMRFADEGNTEHRPAARAQGLDREPAMFDRAEFGSCADNRWREPSSHHIGEEKLFRQRDDRAASPYYHQRPLKDMKGARKGSWRSVRISLSVHRYL